MSRSPAEIRDRWLNYGRSYARYPSLWDGSLAFASGPLMAEGERLRDYSRRTAGAAWSVGVGDVPKYVQASVRGQAFWAGNYDGTDDYGALADIDVLRPSVFSVCCWVNTVTSGRALFANYSQAASKVAGILLSIDVDGSSPGKIGLLSGDGTNIISGVSYKTLSGSVITDGLWHHVCASWDGAYLRLHLDGRFDAEVAWAKAPGYQSVSFPRIGVLEYSAGLFAAYALGSIAATRLHHRVLTANEIATLAQHPLAAFETVRPKYWMFGATTHLWPWQIRRSRRMRGKR